MAKKKRLSRDQKRKAKLADRNRRGGETFALALTGDKYKTDELSPFYLHTETGIYESYVMTDRRLTDRTVGAALTKLILQMRQGPLPPLDDPERVEAVAGREEDLIIANIRRNWEDLFASGRRPSADEVEGGLRTLLGSISVWSSGGAQSRGYLHYIEGFLRQAGVRVEAYSDDFEPEPEPPEDELEEIGLDWCHGDVRAGQEFRKLAEQRIRTGRAASVSEVCRRLLGEAGGGATTRELSALALRADDAQRP